MSKLELRYDSTLLVRCARTLYRRAALSAPLGAVLGALTGTLGMMVAGPRSVAPGEVVLVAITMAVLGFSLGSGRASSLRGQAQALLCQMTIERNTAEVEKNTRIWARLAGRVDSADVPRT